MPPALEVILSASLHKSGVSKNGPAGADNCFEAADSVAATSPLLQDRGI